MALPQLAEVGKLDEVKRALAANPGRVNEVDADSTDVGGWQGQSADGHRAALDQRHGR